MGLLKKWKERAAYSLCPVRCPYCDRVIEQNDIACRKCKSSFPDMCYERYACGSHPCAAAFPYDGTYARAVRCLKFHNRADYAKPLAAQIVQAILETLEDNSFELVTCVPMHKKDKARRGYNQAELLARECAEIMGLPYVETLEKFIRTKPQHKAKFQDRIHNVRGAFCLIDRDLIRDKHVLLIDDIITTGNTLGECAKNLYWGKCRFVSCAVVCTTVGRNMEKNAD